MGFEPVGRERISDRVADALQSAILKGGFSTGQRLPGERQLAEEFGVNRSTVREALRTLERLGLVETRQGQGTRVLDILESASIALLPELIAPGGQFDMGFLRDILEIRVEFNRAAARQAAQRRTEGQIEELESLLEALEQSDDITKIQQLDFDFFHILVRASGNRARILLMNGLRAGYEKHRELFSALYTVPFDATDHRSLLQALKDNDQDLAEQAIRRYTERPLAFLSGQEYGSSLL